MYDDSAELLVHHIVPTYLVRVGTKAKVLDGLTGVLGTPEEDHTGASRGTQGQLVKGEALAAGLLDPGTSSGGEAQSADAQLGDLIEAVVVGHGAHDGADLALVCLARVLVGSDGHNLAQADRGLVDLAGHQTAEDRLVEAGVGSAGEELVQLDEEGEVWVVALGGLAVSASHVVFIEIDTHFDDGMWCWSVVSG